MSDSHKGYRKNKEERERRMPSDAPSSLPHADNAPPPLNFQQQKSRGRRFK